MCVLAWKREPLFPKERVDSEGPGSGGEAQVSWRPVEQVREQIRIAGTKWLFGVSQCTYLENIAQGSQNCLLPFP